MIYTYGFLCSVHNVNLMSFFGAVYVPVFGTQHVLSRSILIYALSRGRTLLCTYDTVAGFHGDTFAGFSKFHCTASGLHEKTKRQGPVRLAAHR